MSSLCRHSDCQRIDAPCCPRRRLNWPGIAVNQRPVRTAGTMRIGLCCRAVTLWLISILPHPPARQVRRCRNGAPGEERHCRYRRVEPRLRGLRNRHSLLHRIGLSPARPPPFSRLNSAHWTIVTSGPSVQAAPAAPVPYSCNSPPSTPVQPATLGGRQT
jgi:hypothetical protein